MQIQHDPGPRAETIEQAPVTGTHTVRVPSLTHQLLDAVIQHLCHCFGFPVPALVAPLRLGPSLGKRTWQMPQVVEIVGLLVIKLISDFAR
jgi:hypothetical protein